MTLVQSLIKQLIINAWNCCGKRSFFLYLHAKVGTVLWRAILLSSVLVPYLDATTPHYSCVWNNKKPATILTFIECWEQGLDRTTWSVSKHLTTKRSSHQMVICHHNFPLLPYLFKLFLSPNRGTTSRSWLLSWSLNLCVARNDLSSWKHRFTICNFLHLFLALLIFSFFNRFAAQPLLVNLLSFIDCILFFNRSPEWAGLNWQTISVIFKRARKLTEVQLLDAIRTLPSAYFTAEL